MKNRTKLNIAFAGMAIIMGMVFLEGHTRNVFFLIIGGLFLIMSTLKFWDIDDIKYTRKECQTYPALKERGL